MHRAVVQPLYLYLNTIGLRSLSQSSVHTLGYSGDLNRITFSRSEVVLFCQCIHNYFLHERIDPGLWEAMASSGNMVW